MTREPFEYTDVLEGRQIRILRVISTSPDKNRIEIELETVWLDEAQFDALSYTWGDIAESHEIVCNGKLLEVRKNLYDFLLHGRPKKVRNVRPDEDGSFHAREIPVSHVGHDAIWVDAICINQQDILEKTSQIRMMEDIYASAGQTIVWLGLGLDQDFQTFAFAIWLEHHIMDPLEVGSMTSLSASIRPRDSIISRYPQYPWLLRDTRWRDLFKILSHPWFSRMWVIQEICNAKVISMKRGSIIVPMFLLLKLGLLFKQYGDINSLEGASDCFRALTMTQIWLTYKAAGPLPLPTWARLCGDMATSDDRDKFFALAGISHSVHPTFVDYSRTFDDIALEVGLLALFGNSSWPELVSGPEVLAEIDNPLNERLNLPSWVPGWFTKGKQANFDLATTYTVRVLENVPKPVITGVYSTVTELEVVGTRRYTSTVDPVSKKPVTNCGVQFVHGTDPVFQENIMFKVRTIDRIESILQFPDLLMTPIAFEWTDLTLTSAREEMADQYTMILQWMDAARRFVNPALNAQDDITKGDDFTQFIGLLIYGREIRWSDNMTQISLPLSFCYYYMSLKLFIQGVRAQNLDHFESIFRALSHGSQRFSNAFDSHAKSRNLCLSEGGMFGWVPLRAKPGDGIFAFLGSRIPFIAKRLGPESWWYTGPAYMHGIMNGEVWNVPDDAWWFMRFV